MPLSDNLMQKIDSLLGNGSALELQQEIEKAYSMANSAAPSASPTLTGAITIGGAADTVGFFATAPAVQQTGTAGLTVTTTYSGAGGSTILAAILAALRNVGICT